MVCKGSKGPELDGLQGREPQHSGSMLRDENEEARQFRPFRRLQISLLRLWRSQTGLIFVIDGSHRLSSLIALINDDYGDGQFSLDAFDGNITDEQRLLAKKHENP